MVVIQSPADGSTVGLGQDVTVTGAASDSVGVDHVVLFADGVSVASTPSATPTPIAPFSLTWLATPAGTHVLQVIGYRADGTAGAPAVLNLVVGGAGSGLPTGLLGSLPPLPSLGLPTLPPPPPATKKPKPSKLPTLPPTTPPSASPSGSATEPATPAPTPTATATILPTPASDGSAPDDSTNDPHFIDIEPTTTNCPADPDVPPIAAVGCVWEQISAPAGDSTDALYFTPIANTEYQLRLSSCSDVSGETRWGVVGGSGPLLNCGDAINEAVGSPAPANETIVLTFAAAPVQLYNLYQFTVYQCQFASCAAS